LAKSLQLAKKEMPTTHLWSIRLPSSKRLC